MVLRRDSSHEATEAVSTVGIDLPDKEVADLERYIDATRGEILFAKGVLLVEGEAERFLLPVLAQRLGIQLDEWGITVCSIAGTAFGSYLKLVGPLGLQLPYAVLTDRDRIQKKKDGKWRWVSLGHNRYRRTWRKALGKRTMPPSAKFKKIAAAAEEDGVYFNDSTFEVELFEAGHHEAFRAAAHDLSTNTKLLERFDARAATPRESEPAQLLKDIETISKGRFAQRLATIIAASEEGECPDYIRKGIMHVAKGCGRRDSGIADEERELSAQ